MVGDRPVHAANLPRHGFGHLCANYRHPVHNKPRPCWLVWNSDHMPPTPGILLEWRKVEDARMAAGFRWEGLVVYAAGGGDLPWHLNLAWERESRIRPMEVPEPPPSKG